MGKKGRGGYKNINLLGVNERRLIYVSVVMMLGEGRLDRGLLSENSKNEQAWQEPKEWEIN